MQRRLQSGWMVVLVVVGVVLQVFSWLVGEFFLDPIHCETEICDGWRLAFRIGVVGAFAGFGILGVCLARPVDPTVMLGAAALCFLVGVMATYQAQLSLVSVFDLVPLVVVLGLLVGGGREGSP